MQQTSGPSGVSLILHFQVLIGWHFESQGVSTEVFPTRSNVSKDDVFVREDTVSHAKVLLNVQNIVVNQLSFDDYFFSFFLPECAA